MSISSNRAQITPLLSASQHEDSGARTLAQSATSSGSFGSWDELIASTGFKASHLFVSVSPGHTTDVNYSVQLGVGSAGNETVIFRGYGSSKSGPGSINATILFEIASGERVAIRVEDDSASGFGYVCGVSLYGD